MSDQNLIDIGIDVGGTFTDFSFFNHGTGEHWVKKVPTNVERNGLSVIEGLLDVDLSLVRNIVHGSTAAINSILQQQGAKTAVITTKGFKDHIEIGDTLRYTGGTYDHNWVRTKPYPIPRQSRFEIDERTESDGTISVKVNSIELNEIAKVLKKEQYESVSVCFLNSYVNPANELSAAEELQELLGNVFVTVSSINPEFREYPRFITSVFNAFVAKSLSTYIENLEQELVTLGYKGSVSYMTSAGGIVTKDVAIREPLLLLFGAIAGGVMAGVYLSELKDSRGTVTFDMGGTSTDVGFIENFTPVISPSKVLVAFPIALPVLDVRSIGAGGGSIAYLLKNGTLKVGPDSAGADPGPICYNKGGTGFTVTDANLLLGRIGENSLLGGEVKLNKSAAEAAAKKLASNVGIDDIYEFSSGVIDLCVTNMYGAIREVSIERGKDPSQLTLVAFGGAGGLHAALLADRLNMPRVIVPRNAGIFSALGLLASDRRIDAVRPYLRPIENARFEEVQEIFIGLATECMSKIAAGGVAKEDTTISYNVGLRYSGQIFEETISYIDPNLTMDNLAKEFSALYEKTYGFSRDWQQIEIVNLRVVALGRTIKPKLELNNSQVRTLALEAGAQSRPIYVNGKFEESKVIYRENVRTGDLFYGPAILEEYDSTTYIPPNWTSQIDQFGSIVLEKQN